MYRYSNGQISLSDFQQSMGMKLREDNRWVKKSQTIPWNKIESRYPGLFPSSTGNVAKPLQLVLGACLIQSEYGYSDEEVSLQIQENPYLQYFCGYAGFDDSKPPFDPSSMVYFRKRLTPEILAEINEIVIQEATGKEHDDNDPGDGGNSGTMTCMPPVRRPTSIYAQQKYMYDNHSHSVPDRIVSVSQPFVRPIVRGKTGKPVEFGMKLDISVVDGCPDRPGQTKEGRDWRSFSGLSGRVRASRGRAQIQFSKAGMWDGTGDSEAGNDSCACGCHVHFGAESA